MENSSVQRADGRLQQAGLAGPRGGHEVDREHAVGVEVLPVVGRLVVVLGQQALEHGDGGAAVLGAGVLAVGPDQMLVPGGDVAAAGIAHGAFPQW